MLRIEGKGRGTRVEQSRYVDFALERMMPQDVTITYA